MYKRDNRKKIFYIFQTQAGWCNCLELVMLWCEFDHMVVRRSLDLLGDSLRSVNSVIILVVEPHFPVEYC